MKFGVIVFPGSNCDRDCFHAVTSLCRQEAEYIWHKETDLKNSDCIILPGGFSYGDYLRAGALASRSPVTAAVVDFAKKGGLVIGICNGFQILTETGLLPGALMQNRGLTFICEDIRLRVENTQTPFTSKYNKDDVITVPIAHMDGCYYADDDLLKSLNDNSQIVFRYEENPNGSVQNIAGICNNKGNVLGLMPHPERCSEDIIGGVEGRGVFESIVNFVHTRQGS